MKFHRFTAHFIGGLLFTAAFPGAGEMSVASKFASPVLSSTAYASRHALKPVILEESNGISTCLLNIASDAAFCRLMAVPYLPL
ncbi:MAG: hypothetical protein AB8V19_02775 [Candidatus Midichloria sp.]|uniref:Uncharacterized protein n=1 Tax=Hyalomma marginatum TaxID=34627 RepID=A0A8S4BVB0_9ACAR|nr:hypothetical protein MHYMCMPASI_00157 [Hyalomma marginatum]CAG7592997.1 hypothetical protein MHYMCMPSP_00766 [Hyalomma marginatum]